MINLTAQGIAEAAKGSQNQDKIEEEGDDDDDDDALATFQWHISYIIYRLYIRDSDEILVVENSFFDLE